jgi:hypothetical protein
VSHQAKKRWQNTRASSIEPNRSGKSAGTSASGSATRYEAMALTDAQVYPQVWGEEYALDHVGSYYEELVAFFHAAAADNESILVRLG